MKIAHLILAVSEPLQLQRLIGSLQHDNAFFFIHVDQKTDISPFQFLTNYPSVYLIKNRKKAAWGAYSIVQATLNGFREIADSGKNIDVVNLLSGSDYPIKNTEQIHSFFAQNPGQNFMKYDLVYEQWHEAITRLTEYHLTSYDFPGKYFVQKWLNKLLPTRKIPGPLVPVGRSQWLSIRMDALKYILKYLEEHPQIVRFFKLTWAPDEIIFQTILYNSVFRHSMVNNNLRYIDWSEGKASPKTLTEEDLPKLLDSDALFARKFNSVTNPEILTKLDQLILKTAG